MTTDFESELRATLDAAGQQAPEPAALADRASAPVRSRRRRSGLAIGAAALGVVAVATSVALLGPGRSTETPVAGGGTTQSSTQNSTQPSKLASVTKASALLGKWRPIQVPGATAKDLRGRPDSPPVITFEKNGKWQGSDGCNHNAGTYVARDGGSFTGKGGPATLMACTEYRGVKHGAAFEASTTFAIDGSTLTLTGKGGKVVAKYEKVPA